VPRAVFAPTGVPGIRVLDRMAPTVADPELALIHLARAANGSDPLQQFVTSYRSHPAGVAHSLVVLCKGFRGEDDLTWCETVLGDVPHTTVRVPDWGRDIASYAAAAAVLEHRYICFLNSFSVVRADYWLSMLYRAAKNPTVGVASATGSWESLSSASLSIAFNRFGLSGLRGQSRLSLLVHLPHLLVHYPRWPNAHVRTNAFVMRRDLFLRTVGTPVRTKSEAQRYESGRRGLTRRIVSYGLSPVVVGADGLAYPVSEWPSSHTFRLGTQPNLLVEDNRTRQYESATADEKLYLSRRAWGHFSEPPDS
jgi:hypothetical protein